VRQAGVAGAEVVDGQRHAQTAQLAKHRQRALQRRDEPRRRPRRHVPPVGDRMDPDRHARRRHRPRRLDQMPDMPVHAAIRHHAHQMRHPTRRPQRHSELTKRRVLPELPRLDGQIDGAQVHRHHPARPDVGVPHLGIAHLPRWQPDIRPVRDQRRMGTGRHQPVEVRRRGQHRRIRRGLRRQAPPVKDAQNHRFRNAHPPASSRFAASLRPRVTGGNGPLAPFALAQISRGAHAERGRGAGPPTPDDKAIPPE